MSNLKLYKCVAMYRSAVFNKWDNFKLYGARAGLHGIDWNDKKNAMKKFKKKVNTLALKLIGVAGYKDTLKKLDRVL